MSKAKINGIDIHYQEYGEGEAMVFAHGAGGNLLSWWQQIPFFSQHYRCITFDHRGFGHSFDEPEGPGGDAFVDGLENAVVDPDVRVRKAACLAIGNCRDLRYREVLEATLADLEWPVRVAAAEGLKRLGDPAACPALMRCTEDPHKVVRNAIRVALGALETA